MESASLLAGNVERLQFLRKKTGIDLTASFLAALPYIVQLYPFFFAFPFFL